MTANRSRSDQAPLLVLRTIWARTHRRSENHQAVDHKASASIGRGDGGVGIGGEVAGRYGDAARVEPVEQRAFAVRPCCGNARGGMAEQRDGPGIERAAAPAGVVRERGDGGPEAGDRPGDPRFGQRGASERGVRFGDWGDQRWDAGTADMAARDRLQRLAYPPGPVAAGQVPDAQSQADRLVLGDRRQQPSS